MAMKYITALMPTELNLRLLAAAEDLGISRSQLIRDACSAYLTNNGFTAIELPYGRIEFDEAGAPRAFIAAGEGVERPNLQEAIARIHERNQRYQARVKKNR